MSALHDILGLFAKLPGAHIFEGARAVATREVLSNIKSLRMIVVTILLGLSLIGGAAGISALTGGGGGAPPGEVFFIHPAFPNGPNGTVSVVVFDADVFGVPNAGQNIVLFVPEGAPGPGGQINVNIVAEAATDANGIVRFDNLNGTSYGVGTREARGIAGRGFVDFSRGEKPVDMVTSEYDLGRNGSNADLVLHAVAGDGTLLGGTPVMVNGTQRGTLDAHGFAHLVLPPGTWDVWVNTTAGGAQAIVGVSQPAPSVLAQGGDVVMFLVAAGFVPLILPIVTIAVAHDAIARERAQGSLDFVLSRPTTRYGILLGKFVGAMVALLIPVLVTLGLGALVIGAMAGSGVSGGFFGAIVLGIVLYMAIYTLLLLILSTLAKTTGTAVMFGVLLWLMFSILWNIVLFVITGAAGLNESQRAYYEVQIYTGLFNPNTLYQAVVAAALPTGASNPFAFNGQELIPSWGPLAAAGVWVGFLFLLALRVFDRRAE